MEKLLNEFDELLKQVNEKADDRLQEEYDDLQESVRENYKPITMYEFHGVNEGDF